MRVSAICPTANRPQYIPSLVETFLKQTWTDKELIVLDSGESIRHLLPVREDIKYFRNEQRDALMGALRNTCCHLATGTVICHFDDDDWSSAYRIDTQVKDLVGYEVTAIADQLFWHVTRHTAYLWEPPEWSSSSASGSSLCYTKKWWDSHQFRGDLARGEDGQFLAVAHNAGVLNRTRNQKRMVYTLRDEPQARVEVPLGELPSEFNGLSYCHTKQEA